MPISDGETPSERWLTHIRVWADGVTYAVVVAAIALLVALVLGIATGGGFVRGKQLLFVFGWLVMAYATWQLWPSTPEDLETEPDPLPEGQSLPETQTETPFQVTVNALPPNRWFREPRPDRRMSLAGKLFIASLLIFGLSYMMEAGLDIT